MAPSGLQVAPPWLALAAPEAQLAQCAAESQWAAPNSPEDEAERRLELAAVAQPEPRESRIEWPRAAREQ